MHLLILNAYLCRKDIVTMSGILDYLPIAGNILDFASNIFNNSANKSAATTAYNRQIQFWNMQNEYNLPSNQIQRLKDAGLNPALMYQSAASGGTASGLSGVQKSQSQAYTKFTEAAMNFLQAKNISEQNENLKADREYKEAQTEALKQQTEFEKQNNTFRLKQSNLKVESMELANEFNSSTIESRISAVVQIPGMNKAKQDIAEQNLRNLKWKEQQEIFKIGIEISQIRKLQAETDLIELKQSYQQSLNRLTATQAAILERYGMSSAEAENTLKVANAYVADKTKYNRVMKIRADRRKQEFDWQTRWADFGFKGLNATTGIIKAAK